MQERTLRQEKKERTRLILVEAATDLFTSRGIGATATADVAKASKVSHGTVFIHFPKREDLILAVIEDFGKRLSQEFQKAVASESRLRGVLQAHLKVLAEYEDFYFRLVTEMQALPPSVQSLAFMLNANVSWRLYESAVPLMKEGRIKRISRPLLFNTWNALLSYHVAHREQLSNSNPILKEKGEELLEHFLFLIELEPEKEKRR